MNEVKERGAAEVIIDLHAGVITVRHGEGSHPTLAQWTANAGDWEKLWERINELKALAEAQEIIDEQDEQDRENIRQGRVDI